MGYHAQPHNNDNVMAHPSDGEAWMEFNKLYPNFAKEVRNVRLGLVTDGFTPFSAHAAHTLVGLSLLFRITTLIKCALERATSSLHSLFLVVNTWGRTSTYTWNH